MITMTKLEEIQFDFCRRFIVDVLMQQKFEDVNLIVKKIHNKKNDPNNTHILYVIESWLHHYHL